MTAREVLRRALRCYADRPAAAERLRAHLLRLDGPVRVAIVGPPGSGASTLVDALRREPKRALRGLDLIDGSLRGAVGGAVGAGAVAAGSGPDADAVLCLLRGRDASQLDGFEPACTIAVLGRTDETGGGRIDALTSARATARRYRRDPDLGALCQDVVPVAGLLALAGRTLTPAEFADLRALADLPRPDLDALLLSTDRFLGSAPQTGAAHALAAPPAGAARALLDRLGLFGVRLSTTLLRTGFDDATRLSAELLRRSGLPELRDAVRVNFVDRAGALQARSALRAVEFVVNEDPASADAALRAGLERATIRLAHELRELRLLAGLRAGGGEPFGEELSDEAARLLGGYGTSVAERLGLDAEPAGVHAAEPAGLSRADGAAARQAVLRAIERWHGLAESPRLPPVARRTAAAVVRSCEGMLCDTLDG